MAKNELKKKMHWSVKLNDVRIRKVKILCFLWIEQQKLNEKLHQGSRFSIVFCAIFLLMTPIQILKKIKLLIHS